MKNQIVQLAMVFAAGIGTGIFHFGGLWVTVRLVPRMRRAVLMSFLSFAGRSGISLILFYVVMNGDPTRLMICVAGFVLARMALVQALRPDRPESLAPPLQKA
jgi:F1F0 ATPase subunit 2